jgi:hypothetical protein
MARACGRVFFIIFCAAFPDADALAQERMITPEVSQAMQDLWAGKATPKQRALLFKNNDVVNKAAMSGWVTDPVYQKVQADYARLNQEFATKAAAEAGAKLRVQQSKSPTYTPGTDSDYITEVKSPEQVKQMQASYNRQINDYLKQEGVLDAPSDTWHNKLDTDFMADPEHVSKADFEKIAKLNNDAYKRRLAARFEATSRANDGTTVSPEEYGAYTEEMKDFVAKKQAKMEKYRNDPSLLNNPAEQAEYHRMMAQEQKYIERIENANRILREQQNLGPQRPSGDAKIYEVVENPDGSYGLKRVVDEGGPSIAKRGSKRSVDSYLDTANASALAENSLNRAVADISESMAEAAQINPEFRAQAAQQIASLTEGMSPAQRGALLDSLTEKHGASFTAEVSQAMRERITTARQSALDSRFDRRLDSALGRMDDSLKGALGVSDDLSKMGAARRGLNQSLGSALGALGKVGVAADIYAASQAATEYFRTIEKAMDPNTSDEEAERLFARAKALSADFAGSAAFAALLERMPTVAAAYGAWTIGYDGTKYVLNNTETGKAFNRAVGDYVDRNVKAAERAKCAATDYLGGESACAKERARQQRLLDKYLAANARGELILREGWSWKDIWAAIQRGDLKDIKDMVIRLPPPAKAEKKDEEKDKDKEKAEKEPETELVEEETDKEPEKAGEPEKERDREAELNDAITDIYLTEPDPERRKELIRQAIARIMGGGKGGQKKEDQKAEAPPPPPPETWEDGGGFDDSAEIDAMLAAINGAVQGCNFHGAVGMADNVLARDPANAWVQQHYGELQQWAQRGDTYQGALSQAMAALNGNRLEEVVSALNVAMANAAVQCGQDQIVQQLLGQAIAMAAAEREEAVREAALEGEGKRRDLMRSQAELDAAAERRQARRRSGMSSFAGALMGALSVARGGGTRTDALVSMGQSLAGGAPAGIPTPMRQPASVGGTTLRQPAGASSANPRCKALNTRLASHSRKAQQLTQAYQIEGRRQTNDRRRLQELASQMQREMREQQAMLNEYARLNCPGAAQLRQAMKVYR